MFSLLWTCLTIFKPIQFAWLATLLRAYTLARIDRFTLTIGCIMFFLKHLTQVIHAGWHNFRVMVIGSEVVIDPIPESTPAEADESCHPGSIFNMCLCELVSQKLLGRPQTLASSASQISVEDSPHD